MLHRMFSRIEFRNTQVWFWLAQGTDLIKALELVFLLIPGMLDMPSARPEVRTRLMSTGYGGLSCSPMEGNRVTLHSDNNERLPMERAFEVVRVLAAIEQVPCVETAA